MSNRRTCEWCHTRPADPATGGYFCAPCIRAQDAAHAEHVRRWDADPEYRERETRRAEVLGY